MFESKVSSKEAKKAAVERAQLPPSPILHGPGASFALIEAAPLFNLTFVLAYLASLTGFFVSTLWEAKVGEILTLFHVSAVSLSLHLCNGSFLSSI